MCWELLLLMLGNRKTVLNIANQPSQAGGNTAKVMVIDNHGFSMFQWIFIGNGSRNHPTNSGNTSLARTRSMYETV